MGITLTRLSRHAAGTVSARPLALVILVLTVVFMAEFSVMAVMRFWPVTNEFHQAIFDATMVTLIAAPTLYFFMLRPLVALIARQTEYEQRLERSEENARAVIKAVGEGIAVTDHEGVILAGNDELARIFGYAPHEMAGMNAGRLIPEALLAFQSSALAGRVAGRRMELEGLRRDGAYFPLEIRVEEAVGAGSERIYTAAIRDISERRQAERALRESERKYRETVNAARSGYWLLNRMGMIVESNDALCDMLGLSTAEVAGRHATEFVAPEHHDVLEECGRKECGTGHRVFGLTLRRADGTALPALASFTVILDEQGEPDGCFAFLTDISELKAQEARLREAKSAAENATRLKDRFISLVAHDLRAPFVSIVGLLNLVERDREHPLAPRQKELIRHVIKSTEASLALIDDLLNVSRLQTGALKPMMRFFDLYELAARAVGTVSHMATAKHLTLVNEVPKGTRVYVDPSLIEQVAVNLIINAIKFTERGGSVRVFSPPGGAPALCVRDEGVGIAPDRMATLFILGKNHSTPGTEGEKGTGFGLPLCAEIVRAHGGALEVASEPDKGSVFTIRLPGVTPRVLTIDRHGTLAEILARTELGPGILCHPRQTMEQAIAALETETFHLIVADVETPGFDLDRLNAALVSRTGGAPPPLALVIPEGWAHAAKAASAASVAEVAVKPVEAHGFAALIRKFTI
ncbi:MAG: PAS domain S-box protein [Nitrospinae bacterium]|nr:PAS domain S-box protein [Nitrospinota bacterium]